MGYLSVGINAYIKNGPYICLGFALVSVFALNDVGNDINNLTNVNVSEIIFKYVYLMIV